MMRLNIFGIVGFILSSLLLTGCGSDYYFKQAQKMEKKGEKAKAIIAYENITKKYPDKPEKAYSYYAIGQIKENEKAYTEAASNYQRFLDSCPKDDPKISEAQFKIAEIRFELQAFPEALDFYNRFLAVAPQNDPKIPNVKYKTAEIKFKEGDFSEAIKLYTEVISQSTSAQVSEYSEKITNRLSEIRDVELKITIAKNQLPKKPDEAVEIYSALLSQFPKFAAAESGLEEARQLQVVPVETGQLFMCRRCSETYKQKGIKTVNVQRKHIDQYKLVSLNGLCPECMAVNLKILELLQWRANALSVLANVITNVRSADPYGYTGMMETAVREAKHAFENMSKQANYAVNSKRGDGEDLTKLQHSCFDAMVSVFEDALQTGLKGGSYQQDMKTYGERCDIAVKEFKRKHEEGENSYSEGLKKVAYNNKQPDRTVKSHNNHIVKFLGVTAAQVNLGFPPELAIDKNRNTRGIGSPWIRVDIGRTCSITRIRLLAGYMPDSAQRILGGDTLGSLKVLKEFQLKTPDNKWFEWEFYPAIPNIRYIEIEAVTVGSSAWREIEVYESKQSIKANPNTKQNTL